MISLACYRLISIYGIGSVLNTQAKPEKLRLSRERKGI
jgi:hypothetical protein